MQSVTCRTRQFQQPYLVLLGYQDILDTRLLLSIVAVDVVRKRRRRMTAALQHTVRQQVAIVILHLTGFRLLIACTGIVEVLGILGRITPGNVRFPGSDGARLLTPPVQIDFIYHRLTIRVIRAIRVRKNYFLW